jgi:hypothetical protein
MLQYNTMFIIMIKYLLVGVSVAKDVVRIRN